MVRRPGRTLPVPMAAIILSPPPQATGNAGGQAQHIGNRGLQLAAHIAGRYQRRQAITQVALRIHRRQHARCASCRLRTSSRPVPEASPHSANRSPVR